MSIHVAEGEAQQFWKPTDASSTSGHDRNLQANKYLWATYGLFTNNYTVYSDIL